MLFINFCVSINQQLHRQKNTFNFFQTAATKINVINKQKYIKFRYIKQMYVNFIKIIIFVLIFLNFVSFGFKALPPKFLKTKVK